MLSTVGTSSDGESIVGVFSKSSWSGEADRPAGDDPPPAAASACSCTC